MAEYLEQTVAIVLGMTRHNTYSDAAHFRRHHRRENGIHENALIVDLFNHPGKHIFIADDYGNDGCDRM